MGPLTGAYVSASCTASLSQVADPRVGPPKVSRPRWARPEKPTRGAPAHPRSNQFVYWCETGAMDEASTGVAGLRWSPVPISVDGLTKRYGDQVAVDELSFVAGAGRVTGFLGPNGSGKTTTMKVMLDLAAADTGGVTIGGSRYRDLPSPTAVVGALVESNAFLPGRSGRDQLRVLADFDGLDSERVDEVLETVGLTGAADRPVGGYSLGMRQRLGLGCALLGDPPVLVLDEPANGLDPKGIREMRDLLRARAAAGGTVLVSSHLLAEIELLADDVVVVDRGRLVVQGALTDLREESVLVRCSASDHLVSVVEAAGATVSREGEDLIVQGCSDVEIGQLAFDAGIVVHRLQPGSGSLEERFLRWTSATPGEGL